MMNLLEKKINPFIIGIGLLSVPVFALLISSLFFVCGLSVNPFIFPLSIALSMLLIYFASKRNLKDFFFSCIYCLLIIAFSLIVAAFFYDYSWDGQCYHQDIILQLKSGWNPIYEHHAPNAHPSLAILVDHYAKGLETISATIYSTTDNMEASKAVNFMFVFASAFLFFTFLKTCFETLSLKKKILLTFLFTLCPVVVCQILTFYIDWAVYSLLLILVSSLICFFKRDSKYNLFIISSVVFLSVTIKFNLFFWVLFTLFFYFIYGYFSKKYHFFQKLILTCAVSGIFGVVIAGFNPYITNMTDHKNPFYPLAGEGKIEIMSSNTPPALKDKSRFESVFISLFSQPNNSVPGISNPTKCAFPFIEESYFDGIKMPDVRIGGFGSFFSWVLVLSILLYFAVIFYKKDILNKNRIKYDAFLFILFISLFILPHAWWARYFPLFYAFPLVMLLYLEKEKKNNISFLNYKNIIYFLCVINTLSMIYGSLQVGKRYKEMVDTGIQVLSKSREPVLINFGTNISFKIKLDHEKIKYEETREQLGISFFLGPNVYFDSEKYMIQDNGFLIEKQ